MQKIRSILKITNSGAALCDIYGSTAGIGLELMLGTGCLLEFELHKETSGTTAQLPDFPAEELKPAACYCALDFSCGNSDDPPLLIFKGVTLKADSNGHTVFTVPINNSAVSRIVSALKERSSAELFCELGGYDGDGNSLFAWQFKIIMRSRVYLGAADGEDTLPPDPAYYTAVQIDAMFSALGDGGVSDSTIPVKDDGNYFSATTVETVLQEIGSELDGVKKLLEDI